MANLGIGRNHTTVTLILNRGGRDTSQYAPTYCCSPYYPLGSERYAARMASRRAAPARTRQLTRHAAEEKDLQRGCDLRKAFGDSTFSRVCCC